MYAAVTGRDDTAGAKIVSTMPVCLCQQSYLPVSVYFFSACYKSRLISVLPFEVFVIYSGAVRSVASGWD